MLCEEEKEALVSSLRGCPVALTTDMWTSTATHPYMTITAHHISDQWQLRSNVLSTRATPDRLTGANIAQHLHDAKEEFGIAVIPAVVTDNAANMVSAAEEAEIARVPCFAHTLQLGVTEGLKTPEAARAIAAGRRLVGHFSHSAMSTQALMDHQTRMGSDKPLCLVQDVATRWNSSYLMMKRLLDLRVALYAVIFDDKVTKSSDRQKLDIKDGDWLTMEKLIVVLEPLAEATELLTKEDVPTASSVYPLLAHLLKGLQVAEDKGGVVAKVKTTIASGLKRRFQVDDKGVPDDEGMIGTLAVRSALDPRYKSLKWLPPVKQEKLHDHLVTLLDGIATIDAPAPKRIKCELDDDDDTPPASTPTTKSVKSSLLDCLQGDVIDLTSKQSMTTSEMMLECYLTEPVRCRDSLQWWRAHQDQFPLLATLARQYLAIPATGVPSERIFSSAGLTVTKLRAGLDPSNVDKLLFLHKNLKSLPKATITLKSEPCPSTSDKKDINQADPQTPALPALT